ncbi:MAG: signal peptidase I [Candidatus Nomurabacteria bacterium]|nr:MAG: signal peptidase I [Candidatus Nomurabacteria bacterium]
MAGREDKIVPGFATSAGLFFVELLKVVIIALAIIVPVRYFLMQPFYVKGASMEPNFHDNEYLIIDELSYRISEPRRGEVVVFHNPRQESEFYIKRIIGLPNEEVKLQHGTIQIINSEHPDGMTLDESIYLPESIYTNGTEDVTLSDNEYFVMGDNRPSSLDSRIFGPISGDSIVGRIWVRAWPFDKLTHFSRNDTVVDTGANQ